MDSEQVDEEILRALDEIVDVNYYEPVERKSRKRSSILKAPKNSDDAGLTEDITRRKSSGHKRRVSFAEKFQVMELCTGNVYDVPGKNGSESSLNADVNSETKSEVSGVAENPNVSNTEVNKPSSEMDLTVENVAPSRLTGKHKLSYDLDSEPIEKRPSPWDSDKADLNVGRWSASDAYEALSRRREEENMKLSIYNSESVFNFTLNRSDLSRTPQRLESDPVANICSSQPQGYKAVVGDLQSTKEVGFERSVEPEPFILTHQDSIDPCVVSLSGLPLDEDKENIYIDSRSKSILVAKSRHLIFKNNDSQVSNTISTERVKNSSLPSKEFESPSKKEIDLQPSIMQREEKQAFGKTLHLNQTMDLTFLEPEPETDDSDILKGTGESFVPERCKNFYQSVDDEDNSGVLPVPLSDKEVNKTKRINEDMEMTCVGTSLFSKTPISNSMKDLNASMMCQLKDSNFQSKPNNITDILNAVNNEQCDHSPAKSMFRLPQVSSPDFSFKVPNIPEYNVTRAQESFNVGDRTKLFNEDMNFTCIPDDVSLNDTAVEESSSEPLNVSYVTMNQIFPTSLPQGINASVESLEKPVCVDPPSMQSRKENYVPETLDVSFVTVNQILSSSVPQVNKEATDAEVLMRRNENCLGSNSYKSMPASSFMELTCNSENSFNSTGKVNESDLSPKADVEQASIYDNLKTLGESNEKGSFSYQNACISKDLFNAGHLPHLNSNASPHAFLCLSSRKNDRNDASLGKTMLSDENGRKTILGHEIAQDSDSAGVNLLEKSSLRHKSMSLNSNASPHAFLSLSSRKNDRNDASLGKTMLSDENGRKTILGHEIARDSDSAGANVLEKSSLRHKSMSADDHQRCRLGTDEAALDKTNAEKTYHMELTCAANPSGYTNTNSVKPSCSEYFTSDEMDLTFKTNKAILKYKECHEKDSSSQLPKTIHFTSDAMDLTCKTNEAISKSKKCHELDSSSQLPKTIHFTSDAMDLTCKTNEAISKSKKCHELDSSSQLPKTIHFTSDTMDLTCKSNKAISESNELDSNKLLSRTQYFTFDDMDLTCKSNVASSKSKEFHELDSTRQLAKTQHFSSGEMDITSKSKVARVISNEYHGLDLIQQQSKENIAPISKIRPTQDAPLDESLIVKQKQLNPPSSNLALAETSINSQLNPDSSARQFDDRKLGILYVIQKLKSTIKDGGPDSSSTYPEIFSSLTKQPKPPSLFSCTKVELSKEVQTTIRQNPVYCCGENELSFIAEVETRNTSLADPNAETVFRQKFSLNTTLKSCANSHLPKVKDSDACELPRQECRLELESDSILYSDLTLNSDCTFTKDHSITSKSVTLHNLVANQVSHLKSILEQSLPRVQTPDDTVFEYEQSHHDADLSKVPLPQPPNLQILEDAGCNVPPQVCSEMDNERSQKDSNANREDQGHSLKDGDQNILSLKYLDGFGTTNSDSGLKHKFLGECEKHDIPDKMSESVMNIDNPVHGKDALDISQNDVNQENQRILDVQNVIACGNEENNSKLNHDTEVLQSDFKSSLSRKIGSKSSTNVSCSDPKAEDVSDDNAKQDCSDLPCKIIEERDLSKSASQNPKPLPLHFLNATTDPARNSSGNVPINCGLPSFHIPCSVVGSVDTPCVMESAQQKQIVPKTPSCISTNSQLICETSKNAMMEMDYDQSDEVFLNDASIVKSMKNTMTSGSINDTSTLTKPESNTMIATANVNEESKRKLNDTMDEIQPKSKATGSDNMIKESDTSSVSVECDTIDVISPEDYEFFVKLDNLRTEIRAATENLDKLLYLKEMDDKQAVFELLRHKIVGGWRIHVPLLFESSASSRITLECILNQGEIDELGLLYFKSLKSFDFNSSPDSPHEFLAEVFTYVDAAKVVNKFLTDVRLLNIDHPISVDFSSDYPRLKAWIQSGDVNEGPYSIFSLVLPLNFKTYPNVKIEPEVEHLQFDEIEVSTLFEAIEKVEPGEYYLSRIGEAICETTLSFKLHTSLQRT